MGLLIFSVSRTHQDNVGYIVEVNVQYGIRVNWKREREREREREGEGERSSKPARKILHRHRVFYMPERLKFAPTKFCSAPSSLAMFLRLAYLCVRVAETVVSA